MPRPLGSASASFRYWVDFQALSSPESAALAERALTALGGRRTGGPPKLDPLTAQVGAECVKELAGTGCYCVALGAAHDPACPEADSYSRVTCTHNTHHVTSCTCHRPAWPPSLHAQVQKIKDYGYMHMGAWELLLSITAKAMLAAEVLRPGQLVCIVPGCLSITRKTSLVRSLVNTYGQVGAAWLERGGGAPGW